MLSLYQVTVLSFALPLFVEALLDKPSLRSNLDAFKPGLQNNLHAPGVSYKQWPSNTISSGCKDLANRENLNPADIATYEVNYADCSVPWLLCRHKNSADSITKMIDDWGKVPVRMRMWTKDILLRPDSGTHAYTLGNQIVFFNDPSVAVYIHEATHALDWSSGFQASGQLASDAAWTNAYNADSAVPDDYARNNQAENLAQFPGLAIFDAVVSGGIRSIEPNVDRIRNQLNTVNSQAANGDGSGQLFKTSGVTCTVRWPNSGSVSTKSSAKFLPQTEGDMQHIEAQRELMSAAGIIMLEETADMTNSKEATNCTVS